MRMQLAKDIENTVLLQKLTYLQAPKMPKLTKQNVTCYLSKFDFKMHMKKIKSFRLI